jgi:hypothetical protein
MLKLLPRLFRAMAWPGFAGILLTAALFTLVRYVPRLDPVQEPGEVLIAGLIGFWTAYWRRHDTWRFVVVAGLLAAALVALVPLGLMLYPHQATAPPAGLALTRAAVAGAMGASVARLLHQRVAL